MAFATLIQPLATSGSRKSDGTANASGKCYFYEPSSTIQATVYADADASATLTQPVSLPASGKATVFCTSPVRVLIQYLVSGTTYGTLDDYTFIPASAGNVGVANDSWMGTDPDDGSIVAGGHTTLDDVLTSIGASVGGSDGLYKESTGATARTLKSVISGIQVSVKDFGAVGNGLASDLTACQAAINRVIARGGGTVLFDAGTYLLSGALTVATSTGVTLKGFGAATILKFSNATANGITATSVTSLVIDNLTIQHSTSSTGVGLSFVTCTAPVVSNVLVTEDDFATGVSFDTCTRSAVQQCDIGCNDTGGGTGVAVAYTNTGSYHAMYGGTTLRGSGSGTCIHTSMGGTSGLLVVTGCHFVSGAVGVNVQAATDPVFVVGCMGLTAMTTAFVDSIGSLRQVNNGIDGYTTGVTNGGNVTPNWALGDAIRIVAAGATATVNNPDPTPTSSTYARRLLLRFVNAAGGTTWTLGASYKVSAAIPATAAHRVHVLFAYDPDEGFVREISRTDMAT